MTIAQRTACLATVVILACVTLAQSTGTGVEKAKAIDSLLKQDKMTLQKAIIAAERRSKGRALRAVSDIDDQGRLMFHIHCFAEDAIVHVQIEGESGRAMFMAEVTDLDERAEPSSVTTPGTSKPASPAAQPVLPIITLAELEFKGKDFLNRRARIEQCTHSSGYSTGDRYRISLHQNRNHYDGIYVNKEQMADVLVQLKSGMTVNVEGVVQFDEDRNRYILACDKIEILPSNP